jgi:hypothetical protein
MGSGKKIALQIMNQSVILSTGDPHEFPPVNITAKKGIQRSWQ